MRPEIAAIRDAVAYLTTDDVDDAAAQLVTDWCDAQKAVGLIVGATNAAAVKAAHTTTTGGTL